MKKTYIKPVTTNFHVSTQSMICGSEKLDGDKTVTNIDALQSRRGNGSVWDDDED